MRNVGLDAVGGDWPNQLLWSRCGMGVSGLLIALGALGIVLQAAGKRWSSNAVAYGVSGSVIPLSIGMFGSVYKRHQVATALEAAARREGVIDFQRHRLDQFIGEVRREQRAMVAAGEPVPDYARNLDGPVDQMLVSHVRSCVTRGRLHEAAGGRLVIAIWNVFTAEKQLLVDQGIRVGQLQPRLEQARLAGELERSCSEELRPLAQRMQELIQLEMEAFRLERDAIDALPKEDPLKTSLSGRRYWLDGQVRP
jgi:hypothetical protein